MLNVGFVQIVARVQNVETKSEREREKKWEH